MVNTSLSILVAGFAGVILGAVYFGGLWWTVRRLHTTSHPVGFFLASFVLRAGTALAGFFLVTTYRWDLEGLASTPPSLPRLAAALVGFILVRVLLLRFLKPGGTWPHGDQTAKP